MAESIRMSLREPLSPAAVEAIWQRIERRRGVRRMSGVAPALAIAAALALVLVWQFAPNLRPNEPVAHVPLGALHWEGAGLGPIEMPATTDPTTEPRRLKLSDGTTIVLAPGTRVVPRVSTATRFELSVERGHARFEVEPQGTRTFAVVAGPARIEVVGTVFAVERDARGVSVSVEHGRVRIDSPTTGAEPVELGAGGTWRWPEPAAAAPTAVPAPASPEIATNAKGASQPSDAAWRNLARAGDFRAAYRMLGPAGFDRAVRGATDAATLLDLSDLARAAGHTRQAADALARLLERHRRDERAPLAALTLGRLRLDAFAEPHEAASALALALALGLPETLREDALARLVEAHARAGESEQAERRASEYRAAFPAGRWRTSVDRWGAGP